MRISDWSSDVCSSDLDYPEGAKPVMKHLYENGVWAIFSTLDPRVLQFKPGVLMTADLCEEVLERVERAIGLARADCLGSGRARRRSARSEERRVGRGGVSTCRSRWSPDD